MPINLKNYCIMASNPGSRLLGNLSHPGSRMLREGEHHDGGEKLA